MNSAPVKMPTNTTIRFILSACGLILFLDSIALMSLGLSNFGVLLPGIFGGVFLLLSWSWKDVIEWKNSSTFIRRSWFVVWLLFLAWLGSVACYFYLIEREVQRPSGDFTSVSSILILGSGTPHCLPSSTLTARLNKGLELASRWPEARIIVSGGEDKGLGCSEASVMSKYLLDNGFSEERLILEEKSTSTYENLQFSGNILHEMGISLADPIAIVTSDFHIFRAKRIARKAGFTSIKGAPSSTPLYLRYNAWLREYFATISGIILQEF